MTQDFNPLSLPVPTGVAARIFGCTESRLAETVRRGRILPPPPVLAGRRLWSRDHLLQAAEALGVLTDKLRAQLEEGVQ